ncbi:hypothetical protein Clacol_006611 [Clathrus columnatus]|uniref:Mitochondrial distribution and morphology protein 12 n=1 Tax=Clathrus columnatus TaxID=1419009 RepID=A0AAV5AK95_9AGAM|nr:hypothetical protein Clacol_006611 [Clathrus columnatus]
MSIDLAWDALIQTSLPSSLINLVNKHLSTIDRPSFIGPVAITSFEFGTASPDIELVDIRDIYPDFLEEEDEKGEGDAIKVEDNLDNFQWIPQKGVIIDEDLSGQRSSDPRYSTEKSPKVNIFDNFRPSMKSWDGKASSSSPNLSREENHPLSTPDSASSAIPQYSTQDTSINDGLRSFPDDLDPSIPSTERPNVQLHFRVTYQSNMRLTMTTSLLVNYPSQSFMTLPMKISVTGFILTGEVVVAYEGSRQRLHLCIVDDLDPHGLSGTKGSQSSVYPDEALNDSEIPPSGKPLPAGIRLLPSVFIESEIGQADKHVLKNGTRVERFIQDVIRKTLEEELLFPNYHTILLEG